MNLLQRVPMHREQSLIVRRRSLKSFVRAFLMLRQALLRDEFIFRNVTEASEFYFRNGDLDTFQTAAFYARKFSPVLIVGSIGTVIAQEFKGSDIPYWLMHSQQIMHSSTYREAYMHRVATAAGIRMISPYTGVVLGAVAQKTTLHTIACVGGGLTAIAVATLLAAGLMADPLLTQSLQKETDKAVMDAGLVRAGEALRAKITDGSYGREQAIINKVFDSSSNRLQVANTKMFILISSCLLALSSDMDELFDNKIVSKKIYNEYKSFIRSLSEVRREDREVSMDAYTRLSSETRSFIETRFEKIWRELCSEESIRSNDIRQSIITENGGGTDHKLIAQLRTSFLNYLERPFKIGDNRVDDHLTIKAFVLGFTALFHEFGFAGDEAESKFLMLDESTIRFPPVDIESETVGGDLQFSLKIKSDRVAFLYAHCLSILCCGLPGIPFCMVNRADCEHWPYNNWLIDFYVIGHLIGFDAFTSRNVELRPPTNNFGIMGRDLPINVSGPIKTSEALTSLFGERYGRNNFIF